MAGLKNKKGFIPSNWPMQPNRYEKMFSNWAAVFNYNGVAYYIEIVSDWTDERFGTHVEILKQTPSGRMLLIDRKFKSVKEAYQHLMRTIGMKENKIRLSEIKKFIREEVRGALDNINAVQNAMIAWKSLFKKQGGSISVAEVGRILQAPNNNSYPKELKDFEAKELQIALMNLVDERYIVKRGKLYRLID